MTVPKKYTIQDIAKELSTTPSTVSRALQDNPRISKKMRKKVKELAVKFDYQPDFRALSLRTGSGRTIGVLVPQVDRHFFATVLRGIDEVATQADYKVMICQSYESQLKELALIRSLLGGKVDGLIASVSIETSDSKNFESFIQRGIPLVFFDRVLDTLKASKVVIDDYKGGILAVEHLISKGCKRIAHFAGPQHIQVYANRTQGYIDTLENHGHKVDPNLIFHGIITRETGCEAMQKILSMSPRPDGLFSSGDYSALGAMLCALEAGLSVPDEIAFVGFANEPFGSIITPTLTSIDQHALEMGRQAALLLIEEIENKTNTFVPRTVMLDPHLIERRSTNRKS
jgi:LacI family transcriptional regulator